MCQCAAIIKVLILPLLGSAQMIDVLEAKTNRLDTVKLVGSLATTNESPMIVGARFSQVPLFPKNYNWNEQDRIIKVIDQLTRDVEQAWPTLLNHARDKRYAITLSSDESTHNYTVGNVCIIMLQESLTAAYLPHVPERAEVYFALRHPKNIPVIPTDAFIEWCQRRHAEGTKLYTLQIECAQWAMAKLWDMDTVGDDETRIAIETIKRKVDAIRRTERAELPLSFFQRELRFPFSSKRAEAIRRKWVGDESGNDPSCPF